jgi:hypothetical protein
MSGVNGGAPIRSSSVLHKPDPLLDGLVLARLGSAQEMVTAILLPATLVALSLERPLGGGAQFASHWSEPAPTA